MPPIHQPEEIILAKYRLTGVLGKGGVAITYSAVDLESNSPIAIKVISLRQLDNWKQVELFKREAEVLKQLSHSHIPAYLDYFDIETETDKAFYLVQQLAPGKSLSQLVESGWRTNEKEVKNIAQQVLEILAYLHSLDPPVIHRDIKPNNLIRSDEGKIYLVDFGAVQNTYYNTLMQGSTVVGTYGYMSPEQFRGQALPATDLYSLGATLLYLLTHRSPAELPQDTLKLDFRSAVDISESFADWLEKMLEPDIEDRFDNAEIALAELSKSKQKKQRKLVTTVSAIALTLGLIAGFNSYKWFFLSRIGYYPSNTCSPQIFNRYIKQGGSIKAINTEEIKDSFFCILESEDEYIRTTEQVLLNNNILSQIIDDSTFTKIYPTPLHIAVRKNKLETIKLLLKYGADINAQTYSGKTPLLYALQNTELNKYSASYQSKKRKNDLEIIEFLLKNGAEVDKPINRYGSTALQYAFYNKIDDLNIIQLLIDYGADINIRDDYLKTPIYKADNREIAHFMIENKALVNVKDKDGNTPLHLIKNSEAIKILIEHGADVNARNKWQRTPLYYAKDKNAVELLIKHGADVNARQINGRTALHRPYKYNQDIVKTLIDNGADINIIDNYGQSPLHFAVDRSIAQLLIDSGAKVNIKDKKENTPLTIAMSRGHKDMVELLIQHGAKGY